VTIEGLRADCRRLRTNQSSDLSEELGTSARDRTTKEELTCCSVTKGKSRKSQHHLVSLLFNKARVGKGSEVRVNGLVHLRTVLPPYSTVPIGWVAVGDPATILPSSEHDRIWSILKPLDFPRVVFGVDRPPPGETMMPNVMPRYGRSLQSHKTDEVL